MPIYEYSCVCGDEKEVTLSFQEYNQPQVCECGEVMQHKVSHISFVTKPYARNMALAQLNKQGNGELQGMPNRWWKPDAERKAFEGLQKKTKAVW